MNKQQLKDFIHFVCVRYSEQWATFNSGALDSVIEMEAQNNGYQLANEPLEAIKRMCKQELKEVYNIK